MDEKVQYSIGLDGKFVEVIPERLREALIEAMWRTDKDENARAEWQTRYDLTEGTLERLYEAARQLELSDHPETPSRREAERALEKAYKARKALLKEYNMRFVPSPVGHEQLLLEALRLLGYEEVVCDLLRKGRPPRGSMSRVRRLSWMLKSGDSCLRYAATMLPKRSEERRPPMRFVGGRIPEIELAKLVRTKLGFWSYREFLARYSGQGMSSDEYLKSIAHGIAWELSKGEDRPYRPRDLVRAYKRHYP